MLKLALDDVFYHRFCESQHSSLQVERQHGLQRDDSSSPGGDELVGEDAGDDPGRAFKGEVGAGLALDHLVAHLHPSSQELGGDAQSAAPLKWPTGRGPHGNHHTGPVHHMLTLGQVGENVFGGSLDDDALLHSDLRDRPPSWSVLVQGQRRVVAADQGNPR